MAGTVNVGNYFPGLAKRALFMENPVFDIRIANTSNSNSVLLTFDASDPAPQSAIIADVYSKEGRHTLGKMVYKLLFPDHMDHLSKCQQTPWLIGQTEAMYDAQGWNVKNIADEELSRQGFGSTCLALVTFTPATHATQ